jgi:predicted nucleic acid-binding protein
MKKTLKFKKLYLDVCTLCRPFDDQDLMRIRLETDALYLIFQNIINGNYDLIVSPVHIKEIESIDDMRERLEVTGFLNRFGTSPRWNMKKIRERAEHLFSLKFGLADAAHLAFAENSGDIFITCDDKILKKAVKNNVKILTINPIEFCIKENLK